MMSVTQNHCVHVPQGRVARMDKLGTRDDVKSLFTSGISNCSIIACIGRERFSLAHIDSITRLEVIQEEAAWVGREVVILVLFRNDYQAAVMRNLLFNSLLAEIGIEPRFCTLQDNDGIQLCSEPVQNSLHHPHLRLHKIRILPPNLIRHPVEEPLTTAQKINQLFAIGNRELLPQNKLIFDGQCWQSVSPSELEPVPSQKNNKRYVDRLRPNMEPRELFNVLRQIAVDIKQSPGSVFFTEPERFAIDILSYVQSHLQKFDYVALFKSRMEECAYERLHLLSPGPEDTKYMKLTLNALKQPGDVYPQVLQIINEYRNQPQTQASKEFIVEAGQHQEKYLEGRMYAVLKKQNEDRKKDAIQENSNGVQAAKDGNFQKAIDHFGRALSLAQLCLCSAEPDLSTIHFNLGRSFQKNGQPNQAIPHLKMAVMLREQDPQKLELAKKALTEAEQQI